MTAKFIRLHVLTTYGPNNLNRDDLSRPKVATFGSVQRLRLSSQCVKRAWRVSDVMKEVVTGTRTLKFWVRVAEELKNRYPLEQIVEHLTPLRMALEATKFGKKDDDGESSQVGLPADDAAEAAPASETGKKGRGAKKPASNELTLESLQGKTVYFYSSSEMDFVRRTVASTLDSEGPTKGKPMALADAEKAVKALPMSADVAMFGRMVAADKNMSVDGAVQVGHWLTVHRALIEDDFFVAVDDLVGVDDSGTGHMGANGFGAGTYYGYINIDAHRLLANLRNDVELARKTVAKLVEAVTTVSPSAKQNSFACHSLASYAMVEVGNAQPVALFSALEKPITGEDVTANAIAALKARAAANDKAYPSQRVARAEFNVLTGEGTLDDVVALALRAFEG